ncbi:NAD(P)H-quinone oxidoreductase [Solitalea canadensis]|uniref:Putative NAD(P)H quinone oxidoreductase, PIG3 family n=1 Tax=Solitalea canadensis (strain ATCC 29591 / DSM 3403 / JCM 21819 / LMG 8368 / NBRC 15130 / NCIMB 12057 / USAM 9D) TaxID=929556 RepID=H8KUK1_SOLCM|nr:NAD(P)H-quinone oxidoreductase [Solitalea canadensis]AFD07425.1 putative NAD(P)H quinone oxidoreductase, PIG3 family [Solitalea canadensis DSM 3403]
MKASIITQPGGPEVLVLQEREKPSIKATEVLVKVIAAGVNRPDVAQRAGRYPAPPGAPADIPGLELAGIIVETGAEVTTLKIGDEVCALVAGGAYAEFCTVPAELCLPVPKGLTMVEAASLPETFFTVWSNVFDRGSLKSEESLLLHGGSSGIGTTAIQMAKALGNTVYATAGSDEKCSYCESLGADKCINYKTEDFEEVIKTITNNKGVDVILDMVGGSYIPKNLNILADDGRLVFINAMKGFKTEVDFLKVMQKRLTITGSTLRPRPNSFKAQIAQNLIKHVWPLIEQGQIKPTIYKTFPLEKANEAHALMESNEHMGKIVLKVS